MLKIILNRGINQCCNNDITKDMHEYQIKRSMIDKYENKHIDKYNIRIHAAPMPQ